MSDALALEVYQCKSCARGPKSNVRGYTADEAARLWTISPPGLTHTERWPGGSQTFQVAVDVVACPTHVPQLEEAFG